ncbi:MAG TPA: tetratricopeptide repeat protein, partial [Bacteroidota bacterium]|nr:tetratricopeptide repeat protein [Bacteroidota bacterium]
QSAIQAFEKALQSDATDAEAHVRVGGARLALKELEEATSSFKAAIHLDPTSAQAHAGLGATLQVQGKTEEAIQCFRRGVESAPSDATLRAQLGNALMEGGDPSGALTAFEHALRLKPDYPEILNNMGLLLKEKGNLDVAEKCYRMAIRVRPGYAPPYNNLGSLLLEKSLFCEAESCCRQALELQSDFHLARNNLANALAGQGRFEEAERLYRETIQADPSIAEVHFNLAASLANNLRFQEALSSYDNALRARPDYPEAHLNRALISLLMGRLDEGWAGYEWRMKVRDPRRLYTAPGPDLQMWDGSDIAGKSILVRCEQGFGDTIQFSRFLPLLKERGAHVVFECHRELCGLFEGFPGVESLQAMKREPPSARFDTYVQLLSLPGLLGIRDVGSIPWPGPYIRADETRVRQWGGRIRCDRPTVGLVWAGNPIHKNDYHRSIPAQIIMPLLDTPGVKFFSLQKGKHAADLEASGRAERLDPHLLDFSETAAAIENLDLVIAVDTAVAHLAGAMGKPVWTLLPYRPDWRWLLERSDSPWYPSMKLFRQSAHGDWPSVIGVVSSELRRFLESAVIRRIRPEVAGARP